MLTITPRGRSTPRRWSSHRLPSRLDSTKLAHRTQHAILSQSGAGPTAPGPLQYHTTLAYHHDKKTPIRLLIVGLTTRAYHHARGTLRHRSYSPLLYHHAQGSPSPSAGHPSHLHVSACQCILVTPITQH